MSKFLMKNLIIRLFSDKIEMIKRMIRENDDNLIFFLLFLRITPLVPNWTINISSSLVGVPFWHYFIGTLLGLIPSNLLLITIGTGLANADKLGLDWQVSF